MLESWPVALCVGTVLGFLSGLGIGGGSLLILWLTIVLGMEQSAARSINLLFFLPAAVIACVFRWKQGAVEFRSVFPAMIAGCLSAAVVSYIGMNIDTTVLRKLFGGLLIITGFRELLYKPKQTSS